MGYYGYEIRGSIRIREEKATEAGRVIQLNNKLRDLEKEFPDLNLMMFGVDEDVISGFIEHWHSNDYTGELPLHEYLGVTPEEYARFVEMH